MQGTVCKRECVKECKNNEAKDGADFFLPQLEKEVVYGGVCCWGNESSKLYTASEGGWITVMLEGRGEGCEGQLKTNLPF